MSKGSAAMSRYAAIRGIAAPRRVARKCSRAVSWLRSGSAFPAASYSLKVVAISNVVGLVRRLPDGGRCGIGSPCRTRELAHRSVALERPLPGATSRCGAAGG
jgi:hypothetical protein